MISAVVYTSNTGSTRRYAEIFGKETGLAVLPLKEAGRSLEKGAEIIYMGWIMAGGIRGYRRAAKRFRVRMVCAVGMGQTGGNIGALRTQNGIPDPVELFSLQGGFFAGELRGIKKLILRTVTDAERKRLEEKESRTPEEESLLGLLREGGSRVSPENLEGPAGWYRSLAEQRTDGSKPQNR